MCAALFPILLSNLTPAVDSESLITDRPVLEPSKLCSAHLLQTVSLHFPGCCLTPSNHFHLTLARRKVPHSIKNRRQRALDDCMFIKLRAPHRGESHLTQKQLKHLLPTHTQNLYNSLCSHHTTHTPLTLELVILFTTGSLKSISRLHSSCCYT